MKSTILYNTKIKKNIENQEKKHIFLKVFSNHMVCI